MGYWSLSVLEASAGKSRAAAAKRYNISRKVLEKLGYLTSDVGDRQTARKASTEVRVFGTRELEGYTPGPAGAGDNQSLAAQVFKQVDVFKDLSDQQIEKVVSLGQRLLVSTGETLGTGGEPAQHRYVILEGEAHLTTHPEVGEISVRIA